VKALQCAQNGPEKTAGGGRTASPKAWPVTYPNINDMEQTKAVFLPAGQDPQTFARAKFGSFRPIKKMEKDLRFEIFLKPPKSHQR
jgi:hypothetical protein